MLFYIILYILYIQFWRYIIQRVRIFKRGLKSRQKKWGGNLSIFIPRSEATELAPRFAASCWLGAGQLCQLSKGTGCPAALGACCSACSRFLSQRYRASEKSDSPFREFGRQWERIESTINNLDCCSSPITNRFGRALLLFQRVSRRSRNNAKNIKADANHRLAMRVIFAKCVAPRQNKNECAFARRSQNIFALL